MPDAANIFQTTLLVLYFITPAETVNLGPAPGSTDKKKAFEKTKIWTLQSTSQIPTETPNMCVANAKLLYEKFQLVSTVTIRTYCLCPANPPPNNVCDEAQKAQTNAFLEKGKSPPPAVIIEIGPDTPMPSSSGLPPQSE
jgi:hypothetical protein